MPKRIFNEAELTALAKRLRIRSGKNRAEAARDLGVSRPSIFHAEESPKLSYLKLRKRMIELYSGQKLVGPIYFLEEG